MMALDGNVIVEPNPAAFPLGMDPWLCGQRLEVGRVDFLEQLAPGLAELAQHAPLVEIGKALGDRRIEFGQAVEDPVAQPAQNPALDALALSFGRLGRAGSTAVP